MIKHKIIELEFLITFVPMCHLSTFILKRCIILVFISFFLCISKQIEEVKTESRRASIIEKKVITEKVKKKKHFSHFFVVYNFHKLKILIYLTYNFYY